MTDAATTIPPLRQVPLEGPVGEILKALGDAVVRVERCDRWRGVARIDPARVLEASRRLFEMDGSRFVTTVGIDVRDGVDILYQWAFDSRGVVVFIKALAARPELAIDAVAQVLPAANWIEREIHDLLGVNFRGHPDMRRLILDDSWPEGVYPLRRDFDQIADRPPLPKPFAAPEAELGQDAVRPDASESIREAAK